MALVPRLLSVLLRIPGRRLTLAEAEGRLKNRKTNAATPNLQYIQWRTTLRRLRHYHLRMHVHRLLPHPTPEG